MASTAALARTFGLRACILLAAILCCATDSTAKKPGRDRLAEALNYLNQARDSTSPTPFLYQAKDEIEGTLIPHKDAERQKALDAIGSAITAVTVHSGERKAIDRAIASVHALAGTGGGGKKKK